MKKRFYLVRHGIKINHAGDPPLSEMGNAQAKAVGEYLKRFPIEEIISSPILRSRQTAKHISDAVNIPVDLSNLLRERVNWGDDLNQSFNEFLEMWGKSTLKRDWVPPVGDSSRASGKRLQKVIEKRVKSHAQIVLVAHGGIIADFLFNVFDNNELNSMYSGFSETKEDNVLEGSITIIDYDSSNKTYELISIALTSHLNKL